MPELLRAWFFLLTGVVGGIIQMKGGEIMLTIEQRAHDLALLIVQYTLEPEYIKEHGKPEERIEDIYIKCYEDSLSILANRFPE